MRRLIIAATLLAALAPRETKSQPLNPLTGHVQDSNGRPIAGARVELLPEGRRVVTDGAGRFSYFEVPLGAHELFVQRVGYLPAHVPFAAKKGEQSLVAALAPDALIPDSVRTGDRAHTMHFSAVVLDELGAPIQDVLISAAGLESATMHTDQHGRFVVEKKLTGPLIIRARLLGFRAFLGSYLVYGDRIDTLRMSRLAQDLTPKQVNVASGYGPDTSVYADLFQRTSVRLRRGNSLLTSEDLGQSVRAGLCQSIACRPTDCFVIDGRAQTTTPPSTLDITDVDMAEEYQAGDDFPVNLFGHGCANRQAGAVVLWLKRR